VLDERKVKDAGELDRLATDPAPRVLPYSERPRARACSARGRYDMAIMRRPLV
jgi:hypothetical protein